MVKRSTLNVNFAGGFEFLFINHYLNGDSFGPSGTSYNLGEPWTKSLDNDGWPNDSAIYDSRTWGVGVRVPSSTDFAGPYVLTWTGNGEVFLPAGTWAVNAGLSSNYTVVNSARWHGTNSRIILNYTGPQLLFAIQSVRTNRDGSGNLMKNIKFYRLEDEADLIAGKVFRSGWKQTLADLNPGAIRFMNWTGPNHSRQTRFEYRPLPSCPSYGGGSNWKASPAYPVSTGVNAIAVASAAGMPVAPMHGEVVTCRMGNATVRNGIIYPTNVTKASPAVVTYDGTAFVPSNGDVLVFQIGNGMTEMDYRPVTVANIDTGAKTFECAGLDSSGFTPFARDASQTGNTTTGSRTVTNIASTTNIVVGMKCFGSGIPFGAQVESKTSTSVTFRSGENATATATGVSLIFCYGNMKQYITLNVGGRGAYPVIFGDGTTPASNYGDGYIAASDYKTFVFDKELVASTAVTGAWTFNDLGAANGHEGLPPLEICTALVNELMAMTRSDGQPVDPIAMWFTVPHRGILSVDPDYSAGSNWAVNATDVIINPASTVRAAGYAALDSRCDLIVEFSNETWNSGGSAFDQTFFLARKGFLRYGGAGSDFSSYTTLRAVLMVNDIKAAFPRASNPRIKYVMAGQGTLGVSGTNGVRINGNAFYDADPLNIWGGDPIAHFDAFAWAAYLLAGTTFDNTNLATYVASWLAASTAEAREAACALYVAGLIGSGSGETISRYGGTLLPAYATAMTAVGKETWMYEGGWDKDVTASSFTVTTTDGSANVTYSGTMTVGSYVVGKGIPDLTTVLSSASGSATLSKQAVASGIEGMHVFTPTSMFLRECKRSWAWGKAFKEFFGMFESVAGSRYPADYIEMEIRWGHAAPNLYLNGVEGGRLDQAWQLLSLRNCGKSRLRAKN